MRERLDPILKGFTLLELYFTFSHPHLRVMLCRPPFEEGSTQESLILGELTWRCHFVVLPKLHLHTYYYNKHLLQKRLPVARQPILHAVTGEAGSSMEGDDYKSMTIWCPMVHRVKVVEDSCNLILHIAYQ